MKYKCERCRDTGKIAQLAGEGFREGDTLPWDYLSNPNWFRHDGTLISGVITVPCPVCSK